MLVISRQPGTSIMIGDAYLLTVVQLMPDQRAASLLISEASPSNPSELEARTVDLVVDVTHRIADRVDVTLVRVSVEKAMLGVNAPKEVSIHRLEVYEAIRRENREDDGAGGAAVRRSPWPPGSPPSLSVRLNPPDPADGAGQN